MEHEIAPLASQVGFDPPDRLGIAEVVSYRGKVDQVDTFKLRESVGVGMPV